MTAVAGGNLAVLLLGTLSSVAAARALGPLVRGQFFATYSLAAVASVAISFSVAQSLVVYGGSDYSLRRPLALHACVGGIGAAAFSTVLLLSGAHPWLHVAGATGAAASLWGALLSSFSVGVAQRVGRMVGWYQWARLVPQACLAVSMLILWALGIRDTNLWLLVTGLSLWLPATAQFGVSLKMLHRTTGEDCGRFHMIAARTAPAVFATLAVTKVDVVLVSLSYRPLDAAEYSVALAVCGVATAFGTAVGMVAFSRLRGIRSVAGQRAATNQALLGTLAVVAVVTIPLIVVAPWAIQLVYGPEFASAAGVTRILLLGSGGSSVIYLLSHALLLFGSQRIVFLVQTATIPVLVGSLAISQRIGGLQAVAWIVVAESTAIAALLYVITARRLRIRDGRSLTAA